ncbi:hypothetical protein BAUCODRAFT_141074 [Baudoinia panamericana UAMH 10762]|uniref:Carboxylic ester hydrolase n=1 Tax=Baudoinia panamericana (strain UAMH 10762) TaxID=717646 RepID=M2LKK0_BAUPA|nr:uncharacterized protein BAUCODRAFT_141074 [Baudoinia panamericana UAMH 10762]EMC94807.1 hypothetical protein BAUCODRAFT_141074 [Baudoinia panamericana UAMH 10762]
MHLSITTLALCVQAAVAAPSSSPLTVRTSTGYYTGVYDANFTGVREFLNVPYGQTTAGKNRWMPPQAVPLSSERFNATDYAPFCPQYVSRNPAVWNRQIPQYLSLWGNANFSAGEPAAFASEDCLSLAIWTPANATSASKLPVALFWTGGGFQTNGILVPGQLPPRWVSRTQQHIVVTINYRMNIMGFPNAAGVYDQNLGLLDQRLSLEWVRDNIVHFGGDPSRIMIWGQSAGAASVDYHNYAFWDEPIAHAIFAQSGNVYNGAPITDPDHTNFTFVAQNVGCNYPNNATAELACMQNVDVDRIIAFMGGYQDNSSSTNPTQPAISFSVVADERIAFSNNTARYAEGFVTKVPIIYSSVANEGGSLAPYPASDPLAGVNQTVANGITESLSLCTGANTTILRNQYGLPPTYRYQYAGNWTNQDPLPWMGAFHSSDLPMIFGAYEYSSANRGSANVSIVVTPESDIQPLEVQTSQTMEDFILAFMKNPYSGPPALGWLPMNTSAPDGGLILRFGANGKAVQNVTGNDVQAVCFGRGPYNPFP